jgi:hypothetical protein
VISRGRLRLVIRRFWSRTPAQVPHNRYILTELAGVSLGHGLDEGTGCDDLQLLSVEAYRHHWVAYGCADGKGSFEREIALEERL